MRPCVRRFVTTFSSLLDRETSVVHSRPQGAGGFVGAKVSRAGRRSRPSRRRQRPVGIERPRGQALPEAAGAGGGEDAGGTQPLGCGLSSRILLAVSIGVHLPAGSGRCTALGPGPRLSATPSAFLFRLSAGKVAGVLLPSLRV